MQFWGLVVHARTNPQAWRAFVLTIQINKNNVSKDCRFILFLLITKWERTIWVVSFCPCHCTVRNYLRPPYKPAIVSPDGTFLNAGANLMWKAVWTVPGTCVHVFLLAENRKRPCRLWWGSAPSSSPRPLKHPLGLLWPSVLRLRRTLLPLTLRENKNCSVQATLT